MRPCQISRARQLIVSRVSRPLALRGEGPLAAIGLVAAAACLLLLVGGAAAQGEPRIVGSWRTVANGDDVQAIAEDGDALWVGSTTGGVARWGRDGSLIRRFLAPQDGLPCNDVRDVVAWRGIWWFATCHGLVGYDAGAGRMELQPADLPSDSLTALAVDAQDRLWVAAEPVWDPRLSLEGKDDLGGWTGGGLALTSDGEHWTAPGDASDWPSRDIRDIAPWRGAMWVAARPHLQWQPPTPGTGGSTQPGRWIPTGGGVGRYDGAWTLYNATTDADLTDAATSLAGGPQAVWVGTEGRGLMAYDGGRWTAYQDCGNDYRCLSDNYVSTVAVAPDGAVIAGTTRFNGRGTGLSMLDSRGTPSDAADDAWTHLGLAQGLPGELIRAIAPEDDAGVWLGASTLDPSERLQGRGLVHLLNDRQTIEVHSLRDTAPGVPADNVITALARDPITGRLWVGTDRGGLSVLEPNGIWHTYTRSSTGGGLGSDSIADLEIGSDRSLWVATRETTYDSSRHQWVDGGLSHFDGDQWSRLTEADGLPSNHLSSLALDDAGKLWVGTGATLLGPKEHQYRGWGLAVVDAGTGAWERTYSFPDLTSNNVTDIAIRGKEVWVSTAYFFYVDPRPGGAQLNVGGGISILDQTTGQWRQLDEEQGLTPALLPRGGYSGNPLLDFRALHVDPQGLVWAGGAAYPDATYAADRPMDAILDVLDPTPSEHVRFDRGGAVTDIAGDAAGNVWVATLGDGLQVRVGDHWIESNATVGRLPSDELTALSVDGNHIWVGTLGNGLAELVPPPTAVPTDEARPTATPGVVVQFNERIFLPKTYRYRRLIVEPVR